MNEQDMEYLGNINTSPGHNAGRSIDSTKPGPNDLRHEPDPTKVICPNCAHQFTAISVADQAEIERLASELEWVRTALRASQIGERQSDAEPDSKLEKSVSRREP